MKYLKSLSLAALAALAVMVVVGGGAASASEPKAEPTAPNVFPVPFHGHGEAGSLLTTSNRSVECKTSVSWGEISSASTIQNAVVTFNECTAFFGFASCTSAGEPAGSIKTNPLHGTLVYLETNNSKKGLLLKPASGTVFASFNCGGTTITVSGEVLAELVAKNHNEYTLHFRRLSNAHPDPASYLSNVGCKHTSTTEKLTATGHGGVSPFAVSPAGISATQTISLTKPTALVATACFP
jgi:hypothetical protein